MRVMISIDKKDIDKLRKLAEAERRSTSQEIVALLDFYLKNKKD